MLKIVLAYVVYFMYEVIWNEKKEIINNEKVLHTCSVFYEKLTEGILRKKKIIIIEKYLLIGQTQRVCECVIACVAFVQKCMSEWRRMCIHYMQSWSIATARR